ncbi:MAG TPA: hypothetical protein VGR35_18960 [Tepidisphaeraceae bacterium]|nr:hypothetical protein [Tepidisphaeraceae bacterium]
MRWFPRTLVAVALGALTGGAWMLERRRSRRRPVVARQRTDAPQPGPARLDPDDADQPPLLSPTWFTLSHMSMLVVLLAMMIGGLMMRGIRRYPPEATWYVHGGDVERGRAALVAHGCGGCHVIPGIRDATGRVGPGLDGFAERMYIGGQLPNTPENLIAWLQDPQRYAPGTAMPKLPITEPVARDMGAFLYSHK